MLTVPCSRSRIVLAKLLARLVAIMIWAVLMVILYYALGVTTLSGYGVLTVIAIALFLLIVSFSLSASIDNFLALFILACGAFLFIGISLYLIEQAGLALMFLIARMHYSFAEFRLLWQVLEDPISMNLQVIFMCVMVVPFIASFCLAFRKFDAKLARIFNLRQLKYFALFYIFCSAGSIVIFIIDLSMRYFK